MKKNLVSMFALATMLLATGCSQEDELVNSSNDYVETSFTVNLVNEAQSRALGESTVLGEGKLITQLYYGIYQDNVVVPIITGTDETTGAYTTVSVGEAEVVNGTATVKMRLVKGQSYDLVFWAQVKDNTHYNINMNDLQEISVNYNSDANDETRDAFFACKPYTVNGHFTETVTLTRPFAQLNVGTSKADFEAAEILLGGKPVTKSSLIVKKLPTTLNLLTGEVGNEIEGAAFKLALLPNIDGNSETNYETLKADVNGDKKYTADEEFAYLSMNYLLAAEREESEVHEVSIEFANENGSINTIGVGNLPVYRNYRTNIIGNILTTDGEFTVVVDNKFVDQDIIYNLDAYTVATTEELVETLNALNADDYSGPENVTIILAGDVEWVTGAGYDSTPLLTEKSNVKTLTIDGGDKYSLTAIGSGVGEICAANGGTIIFKNMKIKDQSKSYNESAWELGYLEFKGSLEFDNVNFVNAIIIEGDNAKFKNCSFNSNNDDQYSVWVSNGYASFEDCEFTGSRGLKMHEAYGSEIAEVIVDACEFGPLSKKPGIAIGDLNAETTVTVKNSVFINCQAGDQDKYIYESDTDVTTFTFNDEGNTVINDEDPVVVMNFEGFSDETTAVVLTEDVTVDKDNQIHSITRTKDLTIYGNGNTIVSTATSIDDFQWTNNQTIPDMSVILSSKEGAQVKVQDLNFTGTMSALMLGNYVNSSSNWFNTELNNVNVIDAEVVSFSSGISPAVCVYGTAILNNCKLTGTTLSSLDTDPMWPVYDVASVNYSETTLNQCKIGTFYMWNQAKVIVEKGTTVDTIVIRGDMNASKYGLKLNAGSNVGCIDLSNITNTAKVNITIEEGATVGKFIDNDVEYASIADWQVAQ